MKIVWTLAKLATASLIIGAVIWAWREEKMGPDPAQGGKLFGVIEDKEGFGAYEMALGATITLALFIASMLLKAVPFVKKAAPNAPVGAAKK